MLTPKNTETAYHSVRSLRAGTRSTILFLEKNTDIMVSAHLHNDVTIAAKHLKLAENRLEKDLIEKLDQLHDDFNTIEFGDFSNMAQL